MTLVKICGITDLTDARLVAQLGGDAVGFNFYKKSRRYIAAKAARDIIEQMGKGPAAFGIFVNESLEVMLQTARESMIDVIQLHGDETPGYTRQAAERSGLRVIKAFRLSRETVPADIDEYKVSGILIDAYEPGTYGGSGKLGDWTAASEIASTQSNVYLAGGLKPENVAEAVRVVRPYAVDVASGVESANGRKDPKRIEDFIRNAKDA